METNDRPPPQLARRVVRAAGYGLLALAMLNSQQLREGANALDEGPLKSVANLLVTPIDLPRSWISQWTRDDTPVSSETTTAVVATSTNTPDTAQETPQPARDTDTMPEGQRAISEAEPLRVWIVGDSMLEQVGARLRDILEDTGRVEVELSWKYSTGLVRPDYHDWPGIVAERLATLHGPPTPDAPPDMVVAMFGANDGQAMQKDGVVLALGDQAWQDEYAERVGTLMDTVGQAGRKIYWIGLPIMRSPHFLSTARTVNTIYAQEASERPLATFVSSWEMFADGNGQYTNWLTDETGLRTQARVDDGVHFSVSGGQLLASHVAGVIDREWGLTGPARAPDGKLLVAAEDVRVRTHRHVSAVRGREISSLVYEPVTEREDARFPVLYFLHGAEGSAADCSNNADELLRELAARWGLVIVCPDSGRFGWYADSPIDPTHRIETYLIDELVPQIEQTFAVQPNARAITGLSMGGHGALALALRNPGTFRSASAMSGIVDLTRHPDQWGLADVFGELDDTSTFVWEAHSVTSLLTSSPDPLRGLAIHLSVATDDPLATAENRDLHAALDERDIAHGYTERPGKHDWSFWLAVLPEHVAFHVARMTSP